MLQINNIMHSGEAGTLKASATHIGWQRADKGRTVVHAVEEVRRAAWFQGKLKVQCELIPEDANEDVAPESTILECDGFDPSDFDRLWRYFKENCDVYLHQHRPTAVIAEADFDAVLRCIEAAADRVDEVGVGSVQRKAREGDLMKQVESVRDGLTQAVQGDRQALNNVFAANGCERIGRMRLVIATVQLSTDYRNDRRWEHLRTLTLSIEGVLKELGTFRVWVPPQDGDAAEFESMMRRQMVWELIQKQGGDTAGLGPLNPLASGGGGGYRPGKLSPAAYTAAEVGLPGLLQPRPDPLERPVEPARPEPPIVEPARVVSEVIDPLAGAGHAPIGGFVAGRPREQDNADAYDQEVMDPNKAPARDPNMGGAGADGGRQWYVRSDSILEGWVWKQSRTFKSWRKRYLILSPSSLETFKPGRTQPRTDLPPTEVLKAGSVQRVYPADGDCQARLSMGIVTTARRSIFGAGKPQVFYMVCDSDKEREVWSAKITEALATR